MGKNGNNGNVKKNSKFQNVPVSSVFRASSWFFRQWICYLVKKSDMLCQNKCLLTSKLRNVKTNELIESFIFPDLLSGVQWQKFARPFKNYQQLKQNWPPIVSRLHFHASMFLTSQQLMFPSNSKISNNVRMEAPSHKPNNPPTLARSWDSFIAGLSAMTFFSKLLCATLSTISSSLKKISKGLMCSIEWDWDTNVILEHSGLHWYGHWMHASSE